MDFFLDGVATVVAAAAAAAAVTIERLDALMTEHRALLGARSGSISQAAAAQSNLAVFDAICRRLVVTAGQIVAARTLTTGRARGRGVLYQPFIDLLDDGL